MTVRLSIGLSVGLSACLSACLFCDIFGLLINAFLMFFEHIGIMTIAVRTLALCRGTIAPTQYIFSPLQSLIFPLISYFQQWFCRIKNVSHKHSKIFFITNDYGMMQKQFEEPMGQRGIHPSSDFRISQRKNVQIIQNLYRRVN